MTKSTTRPWKKSLTTTPTGTENSLISLYDLFYNKDGKLWVNVEDLDIANAGAPLEHDIICLNAAMLNSDNTINTKQSATIETSTWWNYGIDVSIPLYDARAKSKEVRCDAYITTESEVFYDNTYHIYDKDSALEPISIAQFTLRGVCKSDNSRGLTWDTYTPPSIAEFSPKVSGANSANLNTADILLAAPDRAFKSTLVTRDGFSAYNRILINPYTPFAVGLVARATGMHPQKVLGTNDLLTFKNTQVNPPFGTFQKFWSEADNELSQNSVAYAVNLGANSATETSDSVPSTYDSTRWKTLLKNTFVWVRAPFFGDYIKPDSFEQDLTSDSKVVHSELMLTGAADFKKYDMFMTDSAESVRVNKGDAFNIAEPGLGANFESESSLSLVGLSELSMPYVPKTSPTVDIYTSRFMDNDKFLQEVKLKKGDVDGNYSTKLKDVINNEHINNFIDIEASGNDMAIKGLPIAAINRSNARSENLQTESLVPPNWFDPENRLDSDYYKRMGKFPAILPNDGNLYVDGRIISPTVDEFWIAMKKLIGGRTSDTTYSEEKLENLDIGLPVGTGDKLNDTDTTMTEVPDSEFNFDYQNSGKLDKHGDPIDFKYTPVNGVQDKELNNQKLTITKFVNQNNNIVYPVYSSLKVLSDDILTHVQDGKAILSDENPVEEPKQELDRRITNFTAWNDPSSKDSRKVEDKEQVSEGYWAPRAVPYSLRELEAMIMGNKYNIITQARFVKENFAVTGGLGKKLGENPNDMSNFTSGSLYQMHKNYNFDVANPNTFYNSAGTNSGFDLDNQIIGASATIDDIDWRTQEAKADGHIRYVENYGTSNALSVDQETFSSSDVYLSAYGDWRYISDHNRIPILRGEWI